MRYAASVLRSTNEYLDVYLSWGPSGKDHSAQNAGQYETFLTDWNVLNVQDESDPRGIWKVCGGID
jgi:hypothetical protein